ncbi:atp-dependent rna helicase [Vairimorpha apis BRL 01]|uniref:RNA helicase n=1 Tax=Vairimorpha apis BRL 01 TaxID=1037528 RepID=T0KXV9_9MICR|nr:atp-dependent rna helicase [Vairimorpha apis BRL 01]
MKSTSVFLSTLLKNLNVDNAYLNGDQDQKEREFILNEFIKSKFNVLITTDIGSRGIDVVDIDLVINYDVPQTHKDYIHRVGRTARAGKTGLAITIVTQYDIPQFQKIEYMINKKLECYIFDKKYKHLADKIDDLKSKIKEEVKMDKYNK